jgi:membrane protein implicated in regulation of membrane protease activity
MAESSAVTGPSGGAATPPRVLPWLVMYTVGRLGIFALATLLLWIAGLDFWSGLLFGLLLSMAVSYFVLRFARERLNEALAARSIARKAAKEDLRNRLSGGETD